METARPLAPPPARGRIRQGARAFFPRVPFYAGMCALLCWLAACTSPSNLTPAQATVTLLPPPPTLGAQTPEATSVPTTTPPPTPTVASTPTTAPTRPPCLDQGGQITQLTLDTPLTPNPWPFRVYTPPCYHEQPDQHYPLLILIHGTSFKEDQWDRLGVDESADAMIATGELPPFLILLPYDWYWTYEPFNDPFGEALVDYLIPWMDANYRTLPTREYRAIGGLSRGASWAIHLGLEHWELFGAVGAHSLPVFPSDPPFLEPWLKAIPPESVPHFFLDIGEEDNLREKALWFETLLNTYNVPHEWHLFPGTHEEPYWTTHLPQYLQWYAQQWSRPQ